MSLIYAKVQTKAKQSEITTLQGGKMARQIPKVIIRHIVDGLHVATRNSDVIRNLRGRMNASEWNKARRKAAYRYALQVHRENFTLYAFVQTGLIRRKGAAK